MSTFCDSNPGQDLYMPLSSLPWRLPCKDHVDITLDPNARLPVPPNTFPARSLIKKLPSQWLAYKYEYLSKCTRANSTPSNEIAQRLTHSHHQNHHHHPAQPPASKSSPSESMNSLPMKHPPSPPPCLLKPKSSSQPAQLSPLDNRCGGNRPSTRPSNAVVPASTECKEQSGRHDKSLSGSVPFPMDKEQNGKHVPSTVAVAANKVGSAVSVPVPKFPYPDPLKTVGNPTFRALICKLTKLQAETVRSGRLPCSIPPRRFRSNQPRITLSMMESCIPSKTEKLYESNSATALTVISITSTSSALTVQQRNQLLSTNISGKRPSSSATKPSFAHISSSSLQTKADKKSAGDVCIEQASFHDKGSAYCTTSPTHRTAQLTRRTTQLTRHTSQPTPRTIQPGACTGQPASCTGQHIRLSASCTRQTTSCTGQHASFTEQPTGQTASHTGEPTDHTKQPAFSATQHTPHTVRPASCTGRLTRHTRQPASQTGQPAPCTRRLSSQTILPTSHTRQPASCIKRPNSHAKLQASYNRRPPSCTGQRTYQTRMPTSHTRRPSSCTGHARVQASHTRRPASCTGRLSHTRLPTSRTRRLPASCTRQLSSHTGLPTSHTRRPASCTGRPTSYTGLSASNTKQTVSHIRQTASCTGLTASTSTTISKSLSQEATSTAGSVENEPPTDAAATKLDEEKPKPIKEEDMRELEATKEIREQTQKPSRYNIDAIRKDVEGQSETSQSDACTSGDNLHLHARMEVLSLGDEEHMNEVSKAKAANKKSGKGTTKDGGEGRGKTRSKKVSGGGTVKNSRNKASPVTGSSSTSTIESSSSLIVSSSSGYLSTSANGSSSLPSTETSTGSLSEPVLFIPPAAVSLL